MSVSLGIVGAGPAGMMAALQAAEQGARVLLFDSNQMVGRKLLVTGNGRCNLTNDGVAPERYACADPNFLAQLFTRFGRTELLQALQAMGVLTYATHDGWYYPVSNSAATVQQAWASALELAGVQIKLQTKISDIQPGQARFVLQAGGPDHRYTVARVGVAAGGKAYPSLGSKGECFPMLKRLGHTLVPLRPALAPIRAQVNHLHKLQGVRLDVGLAVYEGGRKLGETVGNLMFTQFGFSGPAAMDLSHLISDRKGMDRHLVINLVPRHGDELRRLIALKRRDPVPMLVILGSVLPVKAPPVLLNLLGLPADCNLNQLADDELNRLWGLLTGVTVEVKGTRGYQFSQLSAGGVPVTEVEFHSMESRQVKGLYLVGEVLDVVGPCGGYNLQYAFYSGAVAGVAAVL